MDIQSQSKERRIAFLNFLRNKSRGVLYDTVRESVLKLDNTNNDTTTYPDARHILDTLVFQRFMDLSYDIGDAIIPYFDAMVEPYDNELRTVCLQLAVESCKHEDYVPTSTQILVRAKEYEAYIYGRVPESDEPINPDL